MSFSELLDAVKIENKLTTQKAHYPDLTCPLLSKSIFSGLQSLYTMPSLKGKQQKHILNLL